jgi:hypothetical protein
MCQRVQTLLPYPVPYGKKTFTVPALYLLTKPIREKTCCMHLEVLSQLIYTLIFTMRVMLISPAAANIVNITAISFRAKQCIVYVRIDIIHGITFLINQSHLQKVTSTNVHAILCSAARPIYCLLRAKLAEMIRQLTW